MENFNLEYLERSRWQNPGSTDPHKLSIIHYPYNKVKNEMNIYSTKAVNKFSEEAENISVIMGDDDVILGMLDRNANEFHILVDVDSMEDKDRFVSLVIDPIIQELAAPIEGIEKLGDIENISKFLSRLAGGQVNSKYQEIKSEKESIEYCKGSILNYEEDTERKQKILKTISETTEENLRECYSHIEFIRDSLLFCNTQLRSSIFAYVDINISSLSSYEEFLARYETIKQSEINNANTYIRRNQSNIVSMNRSIANHEENIKRIEEEIKKIEERDKGKVSKKLNSTVKSLSALKFVESASFNESGNLLFRLSPIKITEGGRIYDMGSYQVELAAGNRSLIIQNVQNPDRQFMYPHPHISDYGSRICWGNLASWASDTMRNNDIVGTLSVLWQLITTVNTADAYVNVMSHFPSEKVA